MIVDGAAGSPLPDGEGALPVATVTCPFCHSTDTELISLFGSQHLLDQHRCRACRSYFEALRDDR